MSLLTQSKSILKAPATSSISSFFVRQHSNCLFTHGARGPLHVPAGFRAVTVECDLLCFSGTHFLSPLVARLLCHDSVGRLFMCVSNCVCGCRWCQSGCPVSPLPSHSPPQRGGCPLCGSHCPPRRPHTGRSAAPYRMSVCECKVEC